MTDFGHANEISGIDIQSSAARDVIYNQSATLAEILLLLKERNNEFALQIAGMEARVKLLEEHDRANVEERRAQQRVLMALNTEQNEARDLRKLLEAQIAAEKDERDLRRKWLDRNLHAIGGLLLVQIFISVVRWRGHRHDNQSRSR